MKRFFTLFLTVVFYSIGTTAQNTGIGTTTPTNTLHVFSEFDTAIYAVTTATTPLTPAIYGYSNSVTNNQIGLLGTYNGSGFGAAVAGVGYNGVMPPASKDIGVYASQHTGAGRALLIDGIMQLADGTQGKGLILTSDETGTASWQKPIAGQHAFCATYFGADGTLSVPSNASVNLLFDTEDYDKGNDLTSGIFTAPDTGIYHFDLTVSWSLTNTASNFSLETMLQAFDIGNPFGRVIGLAEHSVNTATIIGPVTQTISTDINLNAGSQVKIFLFQNSPITQKIWGHIGFFGVPYSRFSGHRIL